MFLSLKMIVLIIQIPQTIRQTQCIIRVTLYVTSDMMSKQSTSNRNNLSMFHKESKSNLVKFQGNFHAFRSMVMFLARSILV